MPGSTDYLLVPSDAESPSNEFEAEEKVNFGPRKRPSRLASVGYWLLLIVVGLLCTLFGAFLGRKYSTELDSHQSSPESTKRVPLGTVYKSFTFDSPFSYAPPEEGDAEPIWDALVPNGLGYFNDQSFADDTAITSVFHQLHCLYTVRRAFYSNATEGQLEWFDLGKDRKVHVGHCFDYLVQSITCMSDTTVEPAIDHKHSFIGSDLVRECRDYDQLRQWSEERRVFEAQSFAAKGAPHGHHG